MRSAQRDTLLTTSAVARGADCSETFVRKAADDGKVAHERLADGRRVFRPQAVEAVVALLAQCKRR